MAKYLKNNAGKATEETPIIISAGAADANKIIQTDAAGKLDTSVLPVGVGSSVTNIVTSEALVAGDYINIWNSTGAKVRKASAASPAKPVHGFVLAAYASGATAAVYSSDTNTQLAGLTPGETYYLSDTVSGGVTLTPPTSGAGKISQQVGVANTATSIVYDKGEPIYLAA